MNHEEMAAELNATGLYRVLRKMTNRKIVNDYDGEGNRKAIFVDVETTGLDPLIDEIIELAMVPFTYSGDGRIYEIGNPFRSFQQPAKPIPESITAITGITNEMVDGCSIEPDHVASFIEGAAPIIAHNALFDRRFVEKIFKSFVDKPWACSMSQIDWAAEGYEGTRLAYLTTQAGFFYDKHQAAADALAGVEMLATNLPKSGNLALVSLLDRGRLPTWRIWATGAPFETKDILKARGYSWHPNKKSWHISVGEDAKDNEVHWLCGNVYRRVHVPPMDKITAFDRFSDREIPA